MATEIENLPWTFQNVLQHPEILTRHAAPGTEIGAFDATLGNVVEGDLAVLTPNADALYYPPRICRVRLRNDYHYATDDPVYYPQPFDPQAPHLAIMLTPTRGLNDPYSAAWINPTSDDFKTTRENDKIIVGHFVNSYISSLQKLCLLALSEIPHDSSDEFLNRASSSLQIQVELLVQGGPKKELFARAAIIRRLSLEINARVRWLSDKWQQRLGNAKLRKKAQIANVMGAFTENPEEANVLFHMGIPVWRVIHMDRLPPMQRIDHVSPVIKEDSFGMLFRPDGFMVDCRDADPPHKIIYEGFPRKPERYLSMASYMRSLVGLREEETTMGTKRPRSTIAVSRAAGLTPSVLRDGTVTTGVRVSPYARPSKKHKVTPPEKNPFIVLSRPSMPPALELWEQALKLLADYNQTYISPVHIDSRFSLPPIRKIASSNNPQVVAKLIFGWLRIRSLVLSKLPAQGSSDNKAAPAGQPSRDRENQDWRAGSKEWRCLLEVAGGIYDEGKDQDTLASRRHAEMKIRLRDLGAEEIDIDQISECPVFWDGKPLPLADIPPFEVIRQILWEIAELGFRQDLVSLDRCLDESGMSLVDRAEMLNRCWKGSAQVANFHNASEGLAATSSEDRYPYLRALHQVMGTWAGNKPTELLVAFPPCNGAHNFHNILKRFEESMARFYTRSFLLVFSRPACIPHRL